MALKVETIKKPIPLPQVPPGIVIEDEHEEEGSRKLKNEATDSTLQGQEKPMDAISGIPQVDSILESDTVRRDSSEEPLDPMRCQDSGSEVSLPVLEQRWALDALKNLGLLRQLLLHHLSLSKKQSGPEYQHVPVSSTASEGPTMDHDLTCAQRHSGSNLYPHGADRKVLVSSQIESSSGLRHTPDQDHAAKQIIRTIKTNDKICTEKLAAERGVEEIGDQFFDATEVCSDENANEDDRTGRKDEVELQLRISGNYFILDGCEFGHESSTDEDVSSSIIPQSTEGGSSMDYSSPNTSDGMPADTGGSPFQGVLRPESESHQCPGALLKNPLSNNNISATSSGGMWTDTSSSSLLGSVGTDPCSSSLEGSMWTDTSSSPLAEKARRDPGSTSYPGDLLQLHTGILEEPCYTAENTSFSAESYGRILQYIQIIDADLQHLKDVEEEYHALRQRLTGSANQEQPSNES